MLCYRDRTYCWHKCGNATCPRNFTEKEQRDAELWWQGNHGSPPVAFANYRTNTCGYLAPIGHNSNPESNSHCPQPQPQLESEKAVLDSDAASGSAGDGVDVGSV